LGVQGNHFVGAAQACVVETPSMALSVKKSVSWREESDDSYEDKNSQDTVALVLQAEADVHPPRWLDQPWQVEQSKALYGLKREILASEDEKLIADWRRLTALDYALKHDVNSLEVFKKILADLKVRAEVVKKAQVVEISRAFTKKRDRGNVDVKTDTSATAVKVNFGVARVGGTTSHAVHTTAVQSEAEVPVRRLCVREVEPVAEEESGQVVVQKKSKDKPRGIRKVIRKLVIEWLSWCVFGGLSYRLAGDYIYKKFSRPWGVENFGDGSLALLFFDFVATEVFLSLSEDNMLAQNRIVFPKS